MQLKKTNSVPLSARERKSSISVGKRRPSTPLITCAFCKPENSKINLGYLSQMVNKALYSKYSSSQNYYYTKTINDILTGARLPSVVTYRDLQFYDDSEEYLKRLYRYSEYPGKIKMLSEYYKYHEDIPRLFMLPTTSTLNRYHDKKRRIDYMRITKMLKDQNQQKSLTSKPEIYKHVRTESAPITDRVLADLELSNALNLKSSELLEEEYTKAKNYQKHQEFYQGNNPQFSEKGKIKSNNRIEKENKSGKKKGAFQPQMKNPENTLDQVSMSNTIQDLNFKLGEIINQSNSPSFNFEASEYITNNTISGLENFLAYMQSNNAAAKLNKIPEITSLKPQLKKPIGVSSQRLKTEGRGDAQDRLVTNDIYDIFTAQNLQQEPKRKPSKETNLADKLLKEVPQDYFRKKTKRTVPTEENARILETDRPFTGMVSSRHLTSSVVSSTTARPKNLPIAVIKIQHFDDALKGRQSSPMKVDSQRSASKEKANQRPPSAISYRGNYDSKGAPPKRSESRGHEVLAIRRRSQATMASDFSENSTKLPVRNKSIYNLKDIHLLEKASESSNLTTQQATERPNSQREMRISLDINSIGRHMSQPGTLTNTSNATGKAIREIRGAPNTATNLSERAKSSKGIPLHIGTHTSREARPLTGLGLIDLRTKDSKPASSTNKRSVPQSQFSSQIEDRNSQLMSIIPEQEIVNIKQTVEKYTKKALTQRDITPHHKHTKSEERFAGPAIISLARKGSIVHPDTYREYNRSPYEGKRATKPQTYTYNHNNIVNIFLNHANDKNGNEPSPVLKKEPKRSGSVTERDRTPSAAIKITSSQRPSVPSVPEIFMKYSNPSSGKRLQTYENYARDSVRDRGRESPLKLSKKNEMKLTSRPKSGQYTNSLNIQAHNSKQSLQPKTNRRVELDLGDNKVKGNEANYELLINIKKKQY